MAELPTIKIKADSALGYMIVNQSDFDPKHHEPFHEPDNGPKEGMAPLPELAKLSNKDLAAWGRGTLGLEDMNGRQARAAIMQRINAALAARRDG